MQIYSTLTPFELAFLFLFLDDGVMMSPKRQNIVPLFFKTIVIVSIILYEVSCVNETTIFGDRNFPLATILKMKVAKRRLIEKMSLERCDWLIFSSFFTDNLTFSSFCYRQKQIDTSFFN